MADGTYPDDHPHFVGSMDDVHIPEMALVGTIVIDHCCIYVNISAVVIHGSIYRHFGCAPGTSLVGDFAIGVVGGVDACIRSVILGHTDHSRF